METPPADHPTIRFTPTLDDTLSVYRLNSKPSPLRYAVAAVLIIGFCAVFVATNRLRPSEYAMFILAVLTMCALMAVLLTKVLVPYRARRIFRQQAGLHGPVELSWNDATLTYRTSRGDSAIPWADFRRRREDAKVILLYQSDALFNFIPRRVLSVSATQSLDEHLRKVPLKALRLPGVPA